MRDKEAIIRELAGLSPRLRRFCRALARSDADGDDLAQTALLKALDRLETYRVDDRLDAWVFKIAHRSWLDQRRAEKRRPRAPAEALSALSDEGAGARRPEDRIDLDRLRCELNRLPRDQRAAIVLVAVDGLSYRETAEVLETPIGTVMSRVARGRQTLLARWRTQSREKAR